MRKPPFNGVVIPDEMFRTHASFWIPEMKTYQVVLSIRHPYSRMVSLWRYARRIMASSGRSATKEWWLSRVRNARPTLPQFMRCQAIRERMLTVWSVDWHVRQCRMPDAILRVETLDEDIRRHEFLSGLNVGKHNCSDDPTPSSAQTLTAKSKAMIASLWNHDFEGYGYAR
jgi:hypothetical protein